MKKTIVVLGGGGLGREVYWHILGTWPTAKVVFADDNIDTGEVVIGGEKIPAVNSWNFDAFLPTGLDCGEEHVCGFVIGVGDPESKQNMVKKALKSGLKPFPTIIHPRAVVQGLDCRIGVGGVITPGCVITTNVTIGDYVLLNLNSTVGHDAVLDDFVTINPSCSVSGCVTLGKAVDLGTGTVIRQGISIAPGVVTGAQSCVVKDIDEPGITVVGIPAKKLAR